jgi:hypothetical protein
MRIAPIGTLIQKIHCQAMPSVTAPPSSGPPTTESPVKAVKRPRAPPRFSGGNALVSSATASGMTSAAPAPWIARAAMSSPVSGASAHARRLISRAALVNIVMTRMRVVRRTTSPQARDENARLHSFDAEGNHDR